MPSKFLPWIETPTDVNVLDYDNFNTDTERDTGFVPGTSAHSAMVNTALRQANLVAVALMRIVDPTGTRDVLSDYDDVTTTIKNYLDSATKFFSTDNPKMNGTVNPGTATTVSRSDHVHPVDTSRAPVNHQSTDTNYGTGTTGRYGHVKLVSGLIPANQTYADGVAAAASHTHSFSNGLHKHLVHLGSEQADPYVTIINNSSERIRTYKEFVTSYWPTISYSSSKYYSSLNLDARYSDGLIHFIYYRGSEYKDHSWRAGDEENLPVTFMYDNVSAL